MMPASATIMATLIFGLLAGYLAQRSGVCFVGGIRDLYLFRNAYLAKAVLGLSMGALFGFVLLNRVGGFTPDFPLLLKFKMPPYLSIIQIIIGGIGLGFVSTLAGGCPIRQHIMASEGSKTAIIYLLGFYLGIPYYYLVFDQWFRILIALMG